MAGETFYRQTRIQKDRHTEIIGVALSIAVRKREFDLEDDGTPVEVRSFAENLAAGIGNGFNTAIFKRYDRRDRHPSGAYLLHRDPKKFTGRMALLSIDNLAHLYSVIDDKVRMAECGPGTAVIMDADIEHWVTPPLLDNVRHFAFFGYDATKNPT